MNVNQRYLAAVALLATSFVNSEPSRAQHLNATVSLGAPSLASWQVEASNTAEAQDSSGTMGTVTQGGFEPGTATRHKGDRPRLLAEPFETPHQLLRLLDIGSSDLDSFVDGQPITESDNEAFLKVLFRMPQIGLDDIARWVHDPVPWEVLQADPSKARGEFYRIQGRVKTTTRLPVTATLAALFAFDHYYKVGIEVEGTGRVSVCTRTIPAAWHDQQHLDQRCQVSAMFLKLGSAAGEPPQFLFAAPRIAWLPDRPAPELGIGPDQVLLGDLGMDVGLFDAVRQRNGHPIGAAERECFYALLRAAGRAKPEELANHTSPAQLETLLQQPQKLHGDVLHVLGSVRRIQRVVVDERDIQQRFGIDHYYQLDVLVPLGDTEVQIKSQKKGEAGPVYRSNFPFTCCALSIPAQWEPFVGREKASARVVIDGFFFKLWAYSNPYVTSFDEQQRQLSPWLVLHEPTPAPPVGRQIDTTVGFALGAGFVVVLAVVWVGVWWLNRADRQHSSTELRRRFKSSDQPDLKHLEGSDE